MNYEKKEFLKKNAKEESTEALKSEIENSLGLLVGKVELLGEVNIREDSCLETHLGFVELAINELKSRGEF